MNEVRGRSSPEHEVSKAQGRGWPEPGVWPGGVRARQSLGWTEPEDGA